MSGQIFVVVGDKPKALTSVVIIWKILKEGKNGVKKTNWKVERHERDGRFPKKSRCPGTGCSARV
jgi:hypothetical protein